MRDPFVDSHAEAACAALVYLDADLLATEVLPRDFADRRLGAVWDAAMVVQAEGRPVGLATLEATLAVRAPGLLTVEEIGAVADSARYATPREAREYCRRVIALSRRRDLRDALRRASVDPDEDFDTVAGKVAGLLSDAATGRGGPLGVLAVEGITGAIRSLVAGQKYGLTTGFAVLDETLGGLGPGEVSVLSGVTGSGKTALAVQIADAVAQHRAKPAPVLYLSGEMLAHDLWLRILCSRSRLSLADLRRGVTHSDLTRLITEGDGSRASKLSIVDDGMELHRIESVIRRFAAEQPGGIAVIDHLDHVETDAESQVVAIAKVMRRIKATALAAKVPIIVVAQFNRGFDASRPPTIYDLKGGSAIEQYADSVWLLHYPAPKESPTACQLLVEKNRRGPTGACYLRFEAKHTRFEERNRT